MKKHLLGFIFLALSTSIFAQTTNDVLNLLIKNKIITQSQADSVRAEASIKQQQEEASKKTFFARC